LSIKSQRSTGRERRVLTEAKQEGQGSQSNKSIPGSPKEKENCSRIKKKMTLCDKKDEGKKDSKGITDYPDKNHTRPSTKKKSLPKYVKLQEVFAASEDVRGRKKEVYLKNQQKILLTAQSRDGAQFLKENET